MSRNPVHSKVRKVMMSKYSTAMNLPQEIPVFVTSVKTFEMDQAVDYQIFNMIVTCRGSGRLAPEVPSLFIFNLRSPVFLPVYPCYVLLWYYILVMSCSLSQRTRGVFHFTCLESHTLFLITDNHQVQFASHPSEMFLFSFHSIKREDCGFFFHCLQLNYWIKSRSHQYQS